MPSKRGKQKPKSSHNRIPPKEERRGWIIRERGRLGVGRDARTHPPGNYKNPDQEEPYTFNPLSCLPTVRIKKLIIEAENPDAPNNQEAREKAKRQNFATYLSGAMLFLVEVAALYVFLTVNDERARYGAGIICLVLPALLWAAFGWRAKQHN